MVITSKPSVYIALVHYPVVNKKGDLICSAITNLDLHDIARASRTYGVRHYYVVNPLSDQKILAEKIVSHWSEGDGGTVNPARREAFSLISIVEALDDVVSDIEANTGEKVILLATSARYGEKSISYDAMRDEMEKGGNYLLLFGTAWGLTDEMMNRADRVLYPVRGPGDYNHLSVRSAVSVILDRLLGIR